jgi:hypothetical protein
MLPAAQRRQRPSSLPAVASADFGPAAQGRHRRLCVGGSAAMNKSKREKSVLGILFASCGVMRIGNLKKLWSLSLFVD